MSSLGADRKLHYLFIMATTPRMWRALCDVIGRSKLVTDPGFEHQKEYSLKTRWTDLVDPTLPWPEYPRPQMVRDDWQNLNGTWDYAIAPIDAAGIPQLWQGTIVVPFCLESALSGVQQSLTSEQCLWYRRSFELTDVAGRTLLHFGAVDYEASVWINGAFVQSHSGGFDAFTVDIAAFVRKGTNEVIIRVTDPTSRSDQPRGKQRLAPEGIWYTAVSGIWQTVWIEQVPLSNHIEEVRITPAATCDAISVVAFLARPSRDPELAVRLSVTLNGVSAVELTAIPDREVTLSIPEAQRWSPDSPCLYDLDVSLVHVADPFPREDAEQKRSKKLPSRGPTELDLYAKAEPVEQLDHVRCYFGLRSLRPGAHPTTGAPTLLFNDEPIFQLGPLDQGWWPDGLHTPPCDEAIVNEIEFLKAAGFNVLRKHIKVEPARFYYHCDRQGLMVWQDMPSGFVPAQFVGRNDEGEGLRHSRSTEQFELELQRILNRLHNHPSIVLWVLYNEGWGQFATHRLTDRVRSLDPSRPVNATSGWLDVGAGDLVDRHDYRLKPDAPQGDGVRALVIGEYGGLGWPIEAHLWNPKMRNWGYHAYHSAESLQEAYRVLTARLLELQRSEGICAAIYTQTTDVEGEVNGLMTYDRAIQKLPPEWLAEVHAPFWQIASRSVELNKSS